MLCLTDTIGKCYSLIWIIKKKIPRSIPAINQLWRKNPVAHRWYHMDNNTLLITHASYTFISHIINLYIYTRTHVYVFLCVGVLYIFFIIQCTCIYIVKHNARIYLIFPHIFIYTLLHILTCNNFSESLIIFVWVQSLVFLLLLPYNYIRLSNNM